MPKRTILIIALLAGAIAAVLLLLKPCNAKPSGEASVSPKQQGKAAHKQAPRHDEMPAEPAAATARPEVDDAPPVMLSASDEIPDVAKCVTANFPAEAKPYVKTAAVTVRLVVDKYGNVRSVKTTSVEFGEEPPEDQLPMLRKLFIQAGNRAFGSKKCPPHVVGGQPVGYAIEVPLQFKH